MCFETVQRYVCGCTKVVSGVACDPAVRSKRACERVREQVVFRGQYPCADCIDKPEWSEIRQRQREEAARQELEKDGRMP